jgi:WD40 repeat protein
LWTGDSIVRFSTGEEVRRIKRGTVARHGACYQSRIEWLGERHVVEQCPITSSEEGESDEFESNRLVLWDTQTGESVAEELSPFGVCLAVSPDGSGLAEGCSDYRVRFRNPRTLAVEREFRVHDSGVKSIAWHPSLPILATLGVNEVRFWDVNSGRMLDEIRLRREAYALRFVSQGRQLLVGGALFEPKCCAP